MEVSNDFNLLILDLVNQETGYEGDNILKHNTKQIPTLVYTSKGDEVMFELKEKKMEFPFLLDKLTKLRNGDNLKAFIKQYILRQNIPESMYSLYNENDLILINSLITIGENNFNEIIYKIAEKRRTQKIIIYRMKSGLSGAILFKIEIDGNYYVLKLSKEVEKLKEEHKNAMELYHKFPNRLVNHVDYDEFYTYDNSTLGILLKEVANSKTFFDFVISPETNNTKIKKFLKNLYNDDQGLKNHYHNNKQDVNDWTAIFNKITEQKIFLVNEAYKELKPIIEKYYHLFDIEDFRRLSIMHNYNKLNLNALLDAKYKKMLVLGHGDFHSKNILVQSGHHPVIIDTGSISFQHWCLDICRLIVHLFINGTDFDSVDYFELSSIPRYLDIVDKLLVQEELVLDDVNNNNFHAINWLTKNSSIIFKPEFEIFEYQLGLMKEFMQISYRVDTLPPNKRALALVAAHKSMIAANNNV
jgi:hypothetical protein